MKTQFEELKTKLRKLNYHYIPTVVSLATTGLLGLVVVVFGFNTQSFVKPRPMTSLASGVLSASPNPIQVCDASGVGNTTFSWVVASGTTVELRKDGQSGTLLYQTMGSGSFNASGVLNNSRYYVYSVTTSTYFEWRYVKGQGWARVPVSTTNRQEIGGTVISHTQEGCQVNAPLTISVNPGVVAPGGSYVLSAKLGSQDYNGQLDYFVRQCALNDSVNCTTSSGAWGDYALVSGKVTVTLPVTQAEGFYYAKFKPRNSTVPWSNEVLVTVTNSPVGVRTYQEGAILFLDTGNVKIGADTRWGAAITHVQSGGLDFINRHDPGRESQLAVYDGESKYDNCAGCTGTFGWNPVQGGDEYGRGSQVLSHQLGSDYIYTKTAPLHWNPESQGGSNTQAVVSDVVMEQWIRSVPGMPKVVKVEYAVTNIGTANHTNAFQEFPAFYVNKEFSTSVFYGGNSPWTNAATSTRTYPPLTNADVFFKNSEQWVAQVNNTGQGVGLFAPGTYSMMASQYFPGNGTVGPNGDSTYYIRPECGFTFSAGLVSRGYYYILVGTPQEIRSAVYSLRNQGTVSDICGAFGYSTIDYPAQNQTVSGVVPVQGWLFDNSGVSKVEVLVNGSYVGQAQYGLPRPDVSAFYPGAPTNSGYLYNLDTSFMSNGKNVVQFRVTDTSGIVSLMPVLTVFVSN